MKRFFIGITLLVVLLVAYWAWPFFGLRSLAADIQARDPAALSEDVDFVRLRRSLTEQIIAAYLQVTGRAKKLSPFENVVAIGIGNSIADPFVAQLVTPENLRVLLRGQAVPTDFGNVSFNVGELPSVALGSVWAAWLSRLRLRTLFYWCTCFVTIRRAAPHPDGATAMEVEADGSRVTGLVAKPVWTGIGEEVSMNRTQGEQPAYVPYPSSFGFADVSPSSAAFRTHLSAHPPAAHVRIEHGPPGPRLQFVPVRTAPIVWATPGSATL